MVVGFLNKLLKKNDQEFKDMMKEQESNKKRAKAPETRSKTFSIFVQKHETQVKIKEWMRNYKHKKRGITALLHILWLKGDSEKSIVSTATDILSKLKGQDLFAKLLGSLKLTPEEKMV